MRKSFVMYVAQSNRRRIREIQPTANETVVGRTNVGHASVFRRGDTSRRKLSHRNWKRRTIERTHLKRHLTVAWTTSTVFRPCTIYRRPFRHGTTSDVRRTYDIMSILAGISHNFHRKRFIPKRRRIFGRASSRRACRAWSEKLLFARLKTDFFFYCVLVPINVCYTDE